MPAVCFLLGNFNLFHLIVTSFFNFFSFHCAVHDQINIKYKQDAANYTKIILPTLSAEILWRLEPRRTGKWPESGVSGL